MIQAKEQYIFSFNIAGMNDFIAESELEQFRIIEEVGNVLPTFELNFMSPDEEVIKFLNEGNELKISMGQNQDEMTDCNLLITSLESARLGEGKRRNGLKGILSAMDYLTTPQMRIMGKKSAVEVMKEVTSENFKFDKDNVQKSIDSQYWIQANVPNKAFINQLWMHTDLGSTTFPAIGITSDGKFIAIDMKKLISKPFDWKFTNKIKDKKKDILFDADFLIGSKSGFINSWLGYGREQLINYIEGGTSTYALDQAKPLLAMTNVLTRKSSIEKKIANMGVINDNVHDRYNGSYLRNLQWLAVFGTTTLILSFSNQYKPIRVLDLVMLKEDIPATGGKTQTEYFSGLYLVTKVVRSISSRHFITTIELNRESLNAVKGDLR